MTDPQILSFGEVLDRLAAHEGDWVQLVAVSQAPAIVLFVMEGALGGLEFADEGIVGEESAAFFRVGDRAPGTVAERGQGFTVAAALLQYAYTTEAGNMALGFPGGLIVSIAFELRPPAQTNGNHRR